MLHFAGMKNEIMIKKGDGRIVPFDERKIIQSLRRSGSDKKSADAVLKEVTKRLKPNMTTATIFQIVREELSKKKPAAAARYNLRTAIIKLGPAGFNFEKYVAAVLAGYRYKTKNPDYYEGACIPHEIDVTAEKDGRMAFIEAKFRHDFTTTINIKDVLATWSRFLDLVDGSKIYDTPHFDECWIITNARFTDQSLKFAYCKNMKLIGWNHPHERTFAQMVDNNALYPITIMEELTAEDLSSFAKADLMLCRDVLELDLDQLHSVTGIKKTRLKNLRKSCQDVIQMS